MKTIILGLAFVAAMTIGVVAADEKKPDADNTAQNARDRTGQSKTPIDQSNAPEDLKLTQSIRQAVVKDKSLTITAKNVKIITDGGRVTLRGPVNSAEEKIKIEKIAKMAAGDANVDNQLEVKAAGKK